MRKLYFCLFLLFTVSLSAQEAKDSRPQDPYRSAQASEVKLYPNPAFGDEVQIITRANADKRITVYDVFGEAVLRDKISGKSLDISKLTPGVYVLQVSEGQKNFTRKLVVK